jgi:hypothetical protein
MRRLPVMIVVLFVFVGSAGASDEETQLVRKLPHAKKC